MGILYDVFDAELKKAVLPSDKSDLKNLRDIVSCVSLPPPENFAYQLLDLFEDRGYAPGTIHKLFKLFKRVVNNSFTATSVVELKYPKLPRVQHRTRYFTDEEQGLLYDCLCKCTKQCSAARLLLVFLLDTGARLQEALACRWEDISLSQCTVTLRRTKTNTITKLKMSPRVHGLFNMRAGRTGEPGPFSGDEALAVSLLRTAINFVANSDPFIVETKGKATIHTLRHTFATNALARGVELPVLCMAMGHTNIQQTMEYAHIMGNKSIEEKVATKIW